MLHKGYDRKGSVGKEKKEGKKKEKISGSDPQGV
jgi:hypothetical protein